MEPDSALAWTTSGELLAASGQRLRAVAAYERALALEPDDERITARLRELRSPERPAAN